ncbi:FAD-dependent protein [Mycena kentingensis (nom. inval.)]|nr:FAD-dependent protein [Mycena kentingensis (nom. inval.)]
MGSALSRFRIALKGVSQTLSELEEVNKRIQTSPGLPVADPQTPYWSIPPARIADTPLSCAAEAYADVVIIGSGITGTAVARTLLALSPETRVIMLEAREACSGATARNGGHITPDSFHDYGELREAYDAKTAKEIVRFRLAHLAELLEVSEEEGLREESQCRVVDTFDVHLGAEKFETMKESLAEYLEDMPEQRGKFGFVENVEELQLSPEVVVGVIATKAGAIHSYRFVTGILSRLLARHPDNFQLFTNTPCVSISSNSTHYTLATPKGVIRAKHVVHATNAWASHLLPAMRGKIVPVRGHMTAQRPGLGLGQTASDADSVRTLAGADSSWLGHRSFVIYGENNAGYNYLTQQPVGSSSKTYPAPNGEFMLGGGLSGANVLGEVGVADDHASASVGVSAYLSGVLSMYFGTAWGEEGRPSDAKLASGSEVDPGRILKVWTGILGFSADHQPWVGRLPQKLTRRNCPKASSSNLASPGEWIAAGYSGEGMVHAYLCGKAVGRMLAQSAVEGLVPEPFVVTEKRWKRARLEDFDSVSLV